MAKTTREMIEVMVHYANGGEVEFSMCSEPENMSWKTATNPLWDWCSFSYRIKDDTPSDGVPWEYIDPEWKYFAVDADGTQWLFMACPEKDINKEVWDDTSDQCYISVSSAFIIEENQPWTDSLRKRPD